MVAKVTQANLAALRVAWCRKSGQPPEKHDIKTPPPGSITKRRELIIDRNIIKEYDLRDILVRIRQVWGQFCALCWVFPGTDPQMPKDWDSQGDDSPMMRCSMHVQEKLQEVQTGLWRLLLEQRARFEPNARSDKTFQRDMAKARQTPFAVYHRSILDCTDEELICCTCEYAGMLAALRWVVDDRWKWDAPGIMDLQVHVAP